MGFSRTISKRSVVVALLLSSAVTSALGSRFAQWVRPKLDVVLSPFAEVSMYASMTMRSRAQQLRLGSQRGDGRVEQLQEQIDALQYARESERQRFEEQLRIYQIRDKLYGRMADFPCELIPARVLASDSMPYGATRVVSSKSSPGASVTTRDLLTDRSKTLPENLGAMTAEAMVGRIVDSGEFTARLQLITDRAFNNVDGFIWRDPANRRMILVQRGELESAEWLSQQNNQPIRVVFAGDGKGKVVVSEVLRSHEIRPGDWLVTPGDSRFMPDRIRIGQVAGVQDDRSSPGRVTLIIEPTANLDTLRDVYIVLPVGEPRIAEGN